MKVGLIGAPGAGKDDIAAHVLVNKYGFVRFAFADLIKECYYSESGITDSYFKSCRGTPEEERIRKELWAFSDKMRGKMGKMYFVDQVIDEMKNHENAVVTDIRTEDELEKVAEIADAMIIVVRGDPQFLFDVDTTMFPETRIPLHKVVNYSVFYNISDTLEQARKDFDKYYLKGGK